MNRYPYYVHRLAYEDAKGPIPKGLMVRHTCDVRCCVNPGHLLVGTAKDNCRDMFERGREVVPVGEGCAHAKLNERTVRMIRTGKIPGNPVEIGDALGLSHQTIRDVLSRRTWRHIQ